MKKANCSESEEMVEEEDTIAHTMKYKHELSGDIREAQGRIEKNCKIFGYSVYRLEQIGESYQVNGKSNLRPCYQEEEKIANQNCLV